MNKANTEDPDKVEEVHGHGNEQERDEHIYMQRVEELQEKVEQKDELVLKHDFFSLTVLSYLKQNAALPSKGNLPTDHAQPGGWGLKPEKQAQMLYSNATIGLMVVSMVFCMLYQLIWTPTSPPSFQKDFNLFVVKFPCTIALHLVLCPEVAKGMELMKFANNHPALFVENGAEISYLIGMTQAFCAFAAEAISVFLLVNQEKADECIIYFISLKVIIEVSAFYFESLMHVKYVHLIHAPPKITNFNHSNKFGERSCFHKGGRIFFKAWRGLFVSLFYYYFPFFVLFGMWGLPVGDHEGNAAAGGH